MTKVILTTKIAKAAKCSDIFEYKLRALRALRGQTCFSLFGCGFTTLGPLGLDSVYALGAEFFYGDAENHPLFLLHLVAVLVPILVLAP